MSSTRSAAGEGPAWRRAAAWLARLGPAVRRADEAAIAAALEALGRSRRVLAPLAYAAAGIALLLSGVRLLFSNWRLTVIQVLPALWIWLAMYDLRLHVFHERSVYDPEGLALVVSIAAIVAITVLAFFLNAVFGFAIAQGGVPRVRVAVAEARRRLAPILAAGSLLGLALGLAVGVAPRAGSPWFALALGSVIGLMMVAYVAVPARLIGLAPAASRRDRLSASAVGGLLGVVLSAPPYLIGRVGLLMIGSPILRLPGLLLFLFGATLQAGATSAVRAVKMGAKLSAAHRAPTPPRATS